MALLSVDNALMGDPDPTWRPTIIDFPTHMVAGKAYTIGGIQLNGLSKACSYGDDAQMATNFPIIELVNATTSEIVCCRTFDFSTLGIATGAAIVTTSVEVSTDAKVGNNNMVVIVNGIASQPGSVHIAK